MLSHIIEWLENTELPMQNDDDDNNFENSTLRRIFSQLKVHNLHPKLKNDPAKIEEAEQD